MNLFRFADRYMMYDITPIENLFLVEYLPKAGGDFVKVYLFGLMHCYHPQESATLASMARDLGLTEQQIVNAYAYWERLGLVRRVKDTPPTYQYNNLKQLDLSEKRNDDGLYRYADFNNALQALFGADRMLHKQDYEQVFDWIEGMGLPEEVVLMLVSAQIQKHPKKKFSFSALSNTALQWSQAGVKTVADAETILKDSTQKMTDIRAIYKKLGKRHAVSEPDEYLYEKWTQVWGFSQDTILAACNETVKGVPSTGYLDGILERMHTEGLKTADDLAEDGKADEAVKQLLRELGLRGASPTKDTRQVLSKYLDMGFERETIALAATRVARRRSGVDGLERTLTMWHTAGVLRYRDALTYLETLDEKKPSAAPKGGWQFTQRTYSADDLKRMVDEI